MVVDINSEPGPGRADKNVDSKNQADSATEIPKSNSESMKMFQDKLENNSTGLVRRDIGFLTAEFHSQSDMVNYVTIGHIDFTLTLPQDGNIQILSEGTQKFRTINSIPDTGMSGVSIRSHYMVFCVSYFGTVFAAG